MITKEKSEKSRLVPVISTILSFTDAEKSLVLTTLGKNNSNTLHDTPNKQRNQKSVEEMDTFTSMYVSVFGSSSSSNNSIANS